MIAVAIEVSGMKRQIETYCVLPVQAVRKVMPASRVIIEHDAYGLICVVLVLVLPKEVIPIGRAVSIAIDASRLRRILHPLLLR